MISGAARIGPGWALGVLSLVACCASAATLQRAELQQVGAVDAGRDDIDHDVIRPRLRIRGIAQPEYLWPTRA